MAYVILRQIGRALLLGGENTTDIKSDVEMELSTDDMVGDRRIGDLPLGVNKISAEDARKIIDAKR